MQDFLGGSDSESKNSSQAQGFGGLPQQIQDFFTNTAQAGSNLIPNATAMATPISLTPGEQTAISNINTGFTPTAASISDYMNMASNPYQQQVIDAVQRQANGQGSLVNQAASQAGQMNSNRTLLGQNDIQQTADQTIGSLLSNQFNTNLNTATTVIPQLQMAGATQALQAGQDQRQVALGQSMAPITGLTSIADILKAMPQNSNQSSSSGSSYSSSSQGLLPDIASFF